MKLPYIEGGSFGSIQETVEITEGENTFTFRWISFQPKATVIPIMLSGHCRVNSNWSLFMNSVLSPCFTGIVTLHSVLDCAVNSYLFFCWCGYWWWNSNRFLSKSGAWAAWRLFWSIQAVIRYPSCKHHKDLENPGMGQTGCDCRRLRKRQESSFLLTLAGLIEVVTVGQDLLVLC